MESWKKHILNKDTTSPLDETIGEIYDIAGKHGVIVLEMILDPDVKRRVLEDTRPLFDFTGFDPAEVNVMHLVVAIRATYSFKHKVIGWDEALKVAHDACLLQGEDPKDLLIGLI